VFIAVHHANLMQNLQGFYLVHKGGLLVQYSKS